MDPVHTKFASILRLTIIAHRHFIMIFPNLKTLFIHIIQQMMPWGKQSFGYTVKEIKTAESMVARANAWRDEMKKSHWTEEKARMLVMAKASHDACNEVEGFFNSRRRYICMYRTMDDEGS